MNIDKLPTFLVRLSGTIAIFVLMLMVSLLIFDRVIMPSLVNIIRQLIQIESYGLIHIFKVVLTVIMSGYIGWVVVSSTFRMFKKKPVPQPVSSDPDYVDIHH